MRKTEAEKVSDKIVALLADGRISNAQWRIWIPMEMVRHNKMIVANAKHLADGINEMIETNNIGIDKELNFDYQTGYRHGT